MDNQDKKVIIQDIDMPFNKMVIFGIKWMFAMIPALLAFYFIIFIKKNSIFFYLIKKSCQVIYKYIQHLNVV